jgi:hypothetical protein
VEVVRRWWAGFNEDGMPPLALCDEEIEIRNPPDFPVRGPFYGHGALDEKQLRVDRTGSAPSAALGPRWPAGVRRDPLGRWGLLR